MLFYLSMIFSENRLPLFGVMLFYLSMIFSENRLPLFGIMLRIRHVLHPHLSACPWLTTVRCAACDRAGAGEYRACRRAVRRAGTAGAHSRCALGCAAFWPGVRRTDAGAADRRLGGIWPVHHCRQHARCLVCRPARPPSAQHGLGGLLRARGAAGAPPSFPWG